MILVLGGTADARAAALRLQERGYDVLLSVVSEHAACIARGQCGEVAFGPLRGAPQRPLQVRVGALDEAELDGLVVEAAAVVDATHPFATQISALARRVCERRAVPYLRLERPGTDLPADVIVASDAAAAADIAVATGGDGTILVTVGTRSLEVFVEAARSAGRRLVARVMPTAESVEHCLELGIPSVDIIAIQGPPGTELDTALLRHLGATVLVTKESGEVGGLPAKLEACRMAGARAIVVARPQPANVGDGAAAAVDTVTGIDELVVRVEALTGTAPPCHDAPQPSIRGLRQIYTGDGKGKTTAAVGQAIRARGHGLAVAMVQLVKGGRESGELAQLRKVGVHVVRPASRSTGLLCGTVHPADERAAAVGWREAHDLLVSGVWNLVILDELHSAIRFGLVDLGQVLAALAERPSHVEVITTGRNAPAELCAVADLITEMVPHKHPYPGVPARRGIEY